MNRKIVSFTPQNIPVYIQILEIILIIKPTFVTVTMGRKANRKPGCNYQNHRQNLYINSQAQNVTGSIASMPAAGVVLEAVIEGAIAGEEVNSDDANFQPRRLVVLWLVSLRSEAVQPKGPAPSLSFRHFR